MSLTQDEHTVLLIAGKGEQMMAIGRWEKPIKDLAERGLLYMRDPVNYVITPKGRVALEREEQEENKSLSEALTRVRTVVRTIGHEEQQQMIDAEVARDLKEFKRLQNKYGW